MVFWMERVVCVWHVGKHVKMRKRQVTRGTGLQDASKKQALRGENLAGIEPFVPFLEGLTSSHLQPEHSFLEQLN